MRRHFVFPLVLLSSVAFATPAPTKLVVQGPAKISVGRCAAYETVLVDDHGNPRTVSDDVRVFLDGATSGAFYSDPNCTSEISEVTIPAGSFSQGFHYL